MTTSAEQQILDTIGAIRKARAATTIEQKWLRAHVTDPVLSVKLPAISIVGLHLLSALQSAPQTGIDLAEALGVTRGGVTRAAKKLVDQNLVTTFKRPDDRKKRFYQLTPAGRTLAHQHDLMHQVRNQQLIDQLHTEFKPDELAVINRFLVMVEHYERQKPTD
ncbi:MarR family transcriptional regulator [Lactiplantibacillus garii]|uniref:MarR family transcriptional regulator n=1 Tax=Lactiplantibacillus garii TaxID=2306423 RepID=A0A3R8J8U8_9LACO|nr:MarR family transcriptional regulator [Lactiplantibacillus garii]RRK11487.1 MarR family transcriptional regulator [Lactiplantibacillus garii]